MEAIFRLCPNCPDVEVLVNDGIAQQFTEKKLSIAALIQILKQHESSEDKGKPKIIYDSRILLQIDDYILINQPEHRRYITYSVENDTRSFSILFPNSIYLIKKENNQIISIEAYMYLLWEKEYTQLYHYAMPNMLAENKICIGLAPRLIENNNYIQALENIIYSPYSHAQLNNVKGFSNTVQYFQYLENHSIRKENLFSAKKTLKYIFMDGVKNEL